MVRKHVTGIRKIRLSPVPCVPPCGDEFRYEYDDAYRLSVIASEFGERSFGYDSLDHIVSDTDALGNSYTAEFDLMGNLRRECSPKENASEEQSRYWRYAYDGMDNPIHTESPLGVIYAKEYDGESRLTKEIHPEAENGEGIAYDYDADGHKIRIHYPDGGIKRLFYDVKGRCIYRQDSGQLEASREGMVYATTYRYDLAGNKLEERKAVSEKTVPCSTACGVGHMIFTTTSPKKKHGLPCKAKIVPAV